MKIKTYFRPQPTIFILKLLSKKMEIKTHKFDAIVVGFGMYGIVCNGFCCQRNGEN